MAQGWHIGVIGGSGLSAGIELDEAQEIAVQSPFGEPSGPVFTGRLIDEAKRLTEVLAELTIHPDGVVAQAALLGAVPRALQRPIIAALEQWRFAPIPVQQLHRVQLVFGGN